MTAPEYAAIRQRLALDTEALAAVLGVTRRTVQWHEASGAIPEPVARLMRLLDRTPRLVHELRAMGAE